MKVTFAPYAALTLTIALPGSQSAWAGPSADASRSMTISLAGLNLETPQGRADAHARVDTVARHLCESVADLNDLSRHDNYLRCVDATIYAAMQQLDTLPGRLARKENDRPPQAP